jgi:DNA-binding MarR family transcriptional regulator
MTHDDQNVTVRLLRAFMMHDRIDWKSRTVMGCKPSELKLLFCVLRHSIGGTPEMKVSEISKALRVTSPTVTQLINGLEAKGLVVRSTDHQDRRSSLVGLTDKGQVVAIQARSMIMATFCDLTNFLGEEDSRQLAELLERVFHYFNEKQKEWKGDEDA